MFVGVFSLSIQFFVFSAIKFAQHSFAKKTKTGCLRFEFDRLTMAEETTGGSMSQETRQAVDALTLNMVCRGLVCFLFVWAPKFY